MNEFYLAAALVFVLAGTLKGTVGVGLPAAAVSILSQFSDPRLAISLVAFPILATNLWQVLRGGRIGETLRSFAPFLLVLVPVLWVFTLFAVGIATRHLVLLIGCAVVLFAATSLFARPPRLAPRFDQLGQCLGGALAGVLGGLTAIWSPPVVVYLLSRGYSGDAFVRASGIILLGGSLPLCFGYWQNGVLRGEVGLMGLAMVIPTILGFALGERIRRRLDARRFQKLVLVVFLLMGANLIRRALV